MEELRKITKRKYVSLETKVKIIHTLVFPITMNEKPDRKKKKTDSLEIQC